MSDLTSWAHSIGQSIRRIRLSRGLTQSQLAGEAFSKSYISQLERGSVVPSMRALSLLAERLDLAFTSLLEVSARPTALLLKEANTFYFLGEYERAQGILEQVAHQISQGDHWERCEYHLLAIRIEASGEEDIVQFDDILNHCERIEELLQGRAHRPARIAIPQNYWWGKAWLYEGNQHQAVRKWEIAIEAMARQTGPPSREGLRLLHEANKLYEALGDPHIAEKMSLRLSWALAQMTQPADLSRWILARQAEPDHESSTTDVYDPFEELHAISDAEAWARADATLQEAILLRQQLNADEVDES